MSSAAFTVAAVLNWFWLGLTSALTLFVLRGMSSISKLPVSFKRCFVLAQVVSLIYLINVAVYSSIRAAGLIDIDEDTDKNTLAMNICEAHVAVAAGLMPLAYCYHSLFWFIRLEVTFAGAALILRVTKYEQRLTKGWIILTHCQCANLVILGSIKPQSVNKLGANFYSCFVSGRLLMIGQISGVIVVFVYLCYCIYLSYAFIHRLKIVFIKSSADITYAEKLAIRKTVVIAVTSCIVTVILILAIYVDIGQLFYSLVPLDIFLNTMFIACYFDFAQALYARVFCLCERYSDSFDQCCGVKAHNHPDNIVSANSLAIQDA